jgi:dimethylargininase
MDSILVDHFENLHHIPEPGTVEGGDILQVEDHYFIGLTERTNQAGALAVITILEKYGLTGSQVPVKNMLHLKTGISYLNGQLLVAEEKLLYQGAFQDFPVLRVDPDEAYAANCLYINGRVLLPAGYPKTQRMLENEGFPVKTLDLSEYRKLDGGMSCLSLRF